jgi:tryptophanyl-tRNA synthetase
VEVRDADGRFLFYATLAQAEAALAAGVAAPVGRDTVKYLRLHRVSAASRINTGDFTRRPRNVDHESIGGPWLREHQRHTGDETLTEAAE